MPLVKSPSKAAFKANIKREIEAGKPQKQAVAIAYSVRRRARGESALTQLTQDLRALVEANSRK